MKLFRIFQEVFHAGRDAHHEELHRLGIFIIRKFGENVPKNPKIFAELLFYKTIREANELESGYDDTYEGYVMSCPHTHTLNPRFCTKGNFMYYICIYVYFSNHMKSIYYRSMKGSWTEEQEAELRYLFEENQRNPETDRGCAVF